jgi:hypothetical protein
MLALDCEFAAENLTFLGLPLSMERTISSRVVRIRKCLKSLAHRFAEDGTAEVLKSLPAQPVELIVEFHVRYSESGP